MTIQQNYPAIKPTLNLDFANTKQLDPRITYSRASTGTYYDGKTVAKAEENLLTYSQAFDQWPVVGQCAVTANAIAAPDGTTTADLLVVDSTSTTSRARRNPSLFGTTAASTLSFYVQASGYNCVSVVITSSYGRATLDFVAGTITNYGANSLTLVSSVATGSWYRVVLLIPTAIPSGTDLWLGPNSAIRDPLASWAGDGTSGIYLWGAQLEQRSSVTAYTPTTTAPITNYIPVLQTASAGTPRFDHNPITGESLGLLIEEQRTNLVTFSEQFDNAAWSKTRATITANTIAAPDGTLTADKVVEDTQAQTHAVQSASSTITSSVHTGSCYMKAGERVWAVIGVGTTTSGLAYFDLSTGTVGTVTAGYTASITPAGNGWYRCSVSGTIAASGIGALTVYTATGNNTVSYTGNGYSGIYIWGAQLEAGSFATSYIPTVASQVTRAADSASMTGTNFSSWYNQSQGTVYVEANSNRPLGNFLSLVDIGVSSSTGDRNTIAINNNYISAASITNGVAGLVAETVNTRTAGVAFKGAYSAKENSILSCLNGGVVATDISGSFLKTVNNMKLGVRNDFGVPLNGWISKVAYYPIAVTSTQLQALTS